MIEIIQIILMDENIPVILLHCQYKTTEGLCIFPNIGHLEVSMVQLNASFPHNSHWITSVIGFNGQMFHRWHADWDLSNWRPNVVHPESLSSRSVTFKLRACVCFALQVLKGLLALFLSPMVRHHLSVGYSVLGNEKLCCCCCLQVPCSDKISSSVDWRYCYWPDPSYCDFQGHQLTFCARLNK